MLAPRISLKQLLLFMAVVAIYMALLSLAYRGSTVALGLTLSIAGLAILFAAYGIAYWILLLIASLSKPNSKTKFLGDGETQFSADAANVSTESESPK